MKYSVLSSRFLGAVMMTWLGMGMVACHDSDKDSEPARPAAPTITSIDPSHGLPGATVTIVGTNFIDGSLTRNKVTFNSVAAEVKAATATQLSVIVPQTTTGRVTIQADDQSVTSAADFQIDKSIPTIPTITSITPMYGVPGTTVTITGTNFIDASLTRNKVMFNGVAAEIKSATATQLTVVVPQATTGPVKVQTDDQSVTSTSDFEILKNIPTAGLVAFYPFNGNANDVSGNSLNGTLMNGPASTTDRYAHAGSAYSFDGVDDYINLGHPDKLQIAGAITISGWINIGTLRGTTPGAFTGVVIQKLTASPKGYRIAQDFYGATGDPTFIGNFYTSGTTLAFLGTHPLPLSQWIFFALVIDTDKSMKFYQDGVKQTELTTMAGIDITDADIMIGGNPDYFSGKIDDVAIYNRALSADEVTQLYTQTITTH